MDHLKEDIENQRKKLNRVKKTNFINRILQSRALKKLMKLENEFRELENRTKLRDLRN